MPIKLIEHAFDKNDWFVLIAIVILFAVMFFLPKAFSLSEAILLCLFGVAVASLFDNSIGFRPFDYYDIMDGPAYTGMDVVAYLLYAPFGYFFIYGYKRLGIKKVRSIWYVMAFSALSVGFESICVFFEVFHYKNGYRVAYSYPIYLFVQSALIMFYQYIRPDHKMGK